MRSMSHDSAAPGGRRRGNLEGSPCSESPWRVGAARFSPPSGSWLLSSGEPASPSPGGWPTPTPIGHSCDRALTPLVPGTDVTADRFLVPAHLHGAGRAGSGASGAPIWWIWARNGLPASLDCQPSSTPSMQIRVTSTKARSIPPPGPSSWGPGSAAHRVGRASPSLVVSTPTDVTIDGYRGKATHAEPRHSLERLPVDPGRPISTVLGTATRCHARHKSGLHQPSMDCPSASNGNGS